MPDGQNRGPDIAGAAAAPRPDGGPGRERMLATIDAALAARSRGDKGEVARYLAPGALFRIAGNSSLYGAFPAGPGEAQATVAELIDRVRFHDHERLDAIVEGNRAACRWRIDFSIDDGPIGTTELCDLWTFDAEGRVTELVQFVDTALLVRMVG
ncbi:MAG TPA: nuclear transport factor 2 family protein [Allosphingosinicella sp.]